MTATFTAWTETDTPLGRLLIARNSGHRDSIR